MKMPAAYGKSMLENLSGVAWIGTMLLLSPVCRGWYNRWGATPAEVERKFPDDERVPATKLGYTRAITIAAPVEEVWRWLVQIGQGRGGLYSYERLENLIGCQMHNVGEIIPEHQTLKAGDTVRLGPKGYPLYKVASVDPQRALVLVGADPKTEKPFEPSVPMPESYVNGNWVFVLDRLAENKTRLLVRSRLDYNPSTMNTLVWRVFTEPIGFVMERKMLLGVRQCAEDRYQDSITVRSSQVTKPT